MTEDTQDSPSILEVFGKFAVDLGEGAQLFDTEGEALAALSEFENGAEQRQLAAEYCAYAGIPEGGKNAKGKSNVIVAFLAWVDAGRPVLVATDDVDEEE